jgi:hypothetical protein
LGPYYIVRRGRRANLVGGMADDGTFYVHTTGSRPRLVVSTDGRVPVNHAIKPTGLKYY